MGEQNWAGNVDYGAARLLRPTSVEQLQDMVRHAGRVRVVGSRHSFNELVSTPDTLISLAELPFDIEVGADGRTATVPGAATYGAVTAALHAHGLALPALASLPHISVAGACATGTHGSGDGVKGLASAVTAVEFVQADGALETLRRNDPEFAAAVVNLGAIGAVVRVTFDVVPAFDIRQDVYDDVQIGPYGDELLDALGQAYSVSLFSDFGSDRFTMAWLKRKVPSDGFAAPSPTWRGGPLADGARHPVPGQPPLGTTRQSTVGPWHERLPHFRLDVPPSSAGNELQSEFLVPRGQAPAAWRALLQVREVIAPLLQISEVRSIAGEEQWLSPAYARDSVGFHFTWVPDVVGVDLALTVLEPLLAQFDARPHWGKVFVTPVREVAHRYPRIADFAAVVHRRDPEGRFRNRFVEQVIGSHA
ncbi:FAD-binding protein [Angustibacter sp. McL0619]|uniref:FAD-binding protein n=1 Tax=Angustibacter sp. McL0619 TaxID=3415676 RepID=UPI003CF42B75